LQAIRVRFTKRGRSKFISHLDLNRCMLRAIRRAELPVWYTQGFNPHPYITFALPLSIFYESTCEVMDAKLDAELPLEQVKVRLAAQMPEGIEILGVSEPVMKVGDIAFARYEVTLEFDNRSAAELRDLFDRLLAQESLTIEKTTKHAVRQVDVKPYLIDKNANLTVENGTVRLSLILPAGQDNLNPSCIGATLLQYAEVEADFESVTRTGIYDAAMQPFI
jgi:radical SAM-linked protein